jgi:hypothetical protein
LVVVIAKSGKGSEYLYQLEGSDQNYILCPLPFNDYIVVNDPLRCGDTDLARHPEPRGLARRADLGSDNSQHV